MCPPTVSPSRSTPLPPAGGRIQRCRVRGLGLVLVLLAATGCAGYRLGPTNNQIARARSICVTPFVNQTMEPRLSAEVTAALRKSLQQDGTFRLETGQQADVLLSGAIIEYDRSGVSYRPEDVLTPRDYRVVIKAQVRATDRRSGNVIFDQEVVGLTTVRVGSDLISAERQALPLLAASLARRATSALVDGTW